MLKVLEKRDFRHVGRQFLHAARLGFVMPSGRRVDFESPLPPDLRAALADMREG